MEDPFYGIDGMTAADRTSQSPRALRSSTNDPEAFAKGDVPTSQDGRSSRYDDVNAGVREFESSNGRYDAPYSDRGGIYSRPRRKH